MPHLPFKKKRNHFICSSGIIFKILNGKEVRCPAKRLKSSGRVVVQVEQKWVDLLSMMIEHFDLKLDPRGRLKFTIDNELRIPLGSIQSKKFLSKEDVSEEDEYTIREYRCDIKARSANNRSEQIISEHEIFVALKVQSFKCAYCACEIKKNDWHLDHFDPLCRGGKNIFENIVPACSICNVMKGGMHGYEFVAMVKRIYKNHLYKLPINEDIKI